MKRILAVAGMIVTGTGCQELLCDGTVETTWSWKGDDVPRAALIAAAPASTAVVWDDKLSVLADDKPIVTTTLEIASPKALAMAPDGTGIVVGPGFDVQVFDALGVPGAPNDIDALGAEPIAMFDGSAFSIVWSVGQQVFHARVSTRGELLQGRTLIGVGAPECPTVGAIAAAARDDHAIWVAWTAGSVADPQLVGVRIVNGAVADRVPLVLAHDLPGTCGAGALHGIATSGTAAMLHVDQTVIPLHADGTTGAPVGIGTSPVTLIGAPHGFALVKPYEPGTFPRDLYTRMRMLELDGTEVLQVDVRGASGVYARSGDRWMAATGVDEAIDDDGTSTLGVTRFYEDGQSPPAVLDEARLQHVSTSHCVPAPEHGY